jgi:hypothetical protein
MKYLAWRMITEESWNVTEGIRLFPCNSVYAENAVDDFVRSGSCNNTLQFLCIPAYGFNFEKRSHLSCYANPAHVWRSYRQRLFSVNLQILVTKFSTYFARPGLALFSLAAGMVSDSQTACYFNQIAYAKYSLLCCLALRWCFQESNRNIKQRLINEQHFYLFWGFICLFIFIHLLHNRHTLMRTFLFIEGI